MLLEFLITADRQKKARSIDIDSEDFTPNGTTPFSCGSRNFGLELQSASIYEHIV